MLALMWAPSQLIEAHHNSLSYRATSTSAARCSHTLYCLTCSSNAASGKFSFLHTGDRELVRLTSSQSAERTQTEEHSGCVLFSSDTPCGRLGLERTGVLQLARWTVRPLATRTAVQALPMSPPSVAPRATSVW